MLFGKITEEQEELTAARPVTEIGEAFVFDWDKQELVMANGSPVIVYGAAAIKEWIRLVVRTRRGACGVYPSDFGAPVQALVGQKAPKGFDVSELRRQLVESAAYNPGIREVGSVTWDGSVIRCTVTLEDNADGVTEVIEIEP